MNPTQRRNNAGQKSLSLKEIAELVGGEITGDAALVITGVAGIKEAEKGDITFLSSAKYLPFLSSTRASAVITAKDIAAGGKSLVRTLNPSFAFTQVTSFFHSPISGQSAGIHPTAVIEEGAHLGADVSVGPHAVICARASIGEGTVIGANTFIGADCVLGRSTLIYPNVTVREKVRIGDNVIIHSGTCIGSDGFGYETVDGIHHKIPQIGSVLIEDDVEIGANVCIDRGRFQNTWIKKGVKIDNLVQIAHNVVIGEHSLIVSQVGISGSAERGKGVVVAGQAGVVGHITIGDHATIGAGAGVSKSVPPHTVVLGSPAKPIQEQKKLFAYISRLPELFKEFAEIKKHFKK